MCPICDAEDRKPWFSIDGYSIQKCNQCSHGYVYPSPDPEQVSKLYEELGEDDFLGNGLAYQVADYFDENPNRLLAFHSYAQAFLDSNQVPKSARIFDYGCAMGTFLRALGLGGYENGVGFDIQNDLVEHGKKRWALNLETGQEDAFFDRNSGAFDVVFSTNVLEHVPDPCKTLNSLVRCLKPGGYLVLSIPNADSIQVKIAGTKSPIIDPPHHLQYFSPQSLENAFFKAKLEVQECKTIFWDIGSDVFLNMYGVPMWLGAGLRKLMWLPKVFIDKKNLGGVVRIFARKPE